MGTTRYEERGRTSADLNQQDRFLSCERHFAVETNVAFAHNPGTRARELIRSLEVAGEIGHIRDTYLPRSVTIVRREVSVIAL